MRAIEFRAWYIDEEVMAYSDDDAEFDVAYWDGANCSRIAMLNHLCKPLNMILMQYTGLQDAKGNKVYESDILEFDNGDRFFIDCEDWLELFVHWIGEPECEDQARDFYRIERAIVIGNKYQNKELLNEQKTANIGTDRDG